MTPGPERRPWTRKDDALLRAKHAAGKTAHDIARELGRTTAVVYRKLADQGLAPHVRTPEQRSEANARGAETRHGDAVSAGRAAAKEVARREAAEMARGGGGTIRDAWKLAFGNRLAEHPEKGFVLDGRPINLDPLMRLTNADRRRRGLPPVGNNPCWLGE